MRLWSVGVQEGIEYDSALTDAPPELRQDRIEIFPLGGFIYITDEVFTKQPQIALRIVQSFFAKIEKLQRITNSISPWCEVDDLLWRLCVRPELMEHLFQHCQDHAQELDEGNPDVQRLVNKQKIIMYTHTYFDAALPSCTHFSLKQTTLSKTIQRFLLVSFPTNTPSSPSAASLRKYNPSTTLTPSHGAKKTPTCT